MVNLAILGEKGCLAWLKREATVDIMNNRYMK